MSSRSSDISNPGVTLLIQDGCNKLDFSRQRLKKIPKHPNTSLLPHITQLTLDHNELQRLECLSQYPSLIEFSAMHNQVYKMSCVSTLKHLVRLDLSHNCILSIEGLRDLVHLTFLNLSHNKIKVLDHLSTNVQLEHLDLSANSIAAISDIHSLTKLKKLLLHCNSVTSLKCCGLYLPPSLEALTLAGNKIADLNEISYLCELSHLSEISIANNPCVQMTDNKVGFDYRPFLINWCLGLRVIDGYEIDDIEKTSTIDVEDYRCLKGEWLFSQGGGRRFRIGEHTALIRYLSKTCPLNDQFLQTEHERKLRLILTKAHHHQSQLRLSEGSVSSPDSSFLLKQSLSGLMSQSLDPTLLEISGPRKPRLLDDGDLTRSLHCAPTSFLNETSAPPRSAPTPPHSTPAPLNTTPASHPTAPAPLPAASKLVPVPESLISPLVTNTPPLVIPASSHSQGHLSGGDAVSARKLQTIKNAAEKKKVQRDKNCDKEQAAIRIQKIWRGYHTRNLNPKVLTLFHEMHLRRTNRYILKLSQEVEATRAALESGHRLQMLQMQAINALWRKVVGLQPSKLDESIGEVKVLAHTCGRLDAQVQQLQSCLQQVLRCVSPSSSNAMSTQTDDLPLPSIHLEVSLEKPLQSRPSSLPIIPQVNAYCENFLDEGGIGSPDDNNQPCQQVSSQ